MPQPLVVSLARGRDQSIDPRIAPAGTIARAENVRLDKQGRLVPRNGYTALPMTITRSSSAATMVPFDMHSIDGDELVVLGEQGIESTMGPKFAFRRAPSVRGEWSWAGEPAFGDTNANAHQLPTVTELRLLSASKRAVPATAPLSSSCAITTSGIVAHVASSVDSTRRGTLQLMTPDGEEIHSNVLGQLVGSLRSNVRMVAIGNILVITMQSGDNILGVAYDTATQVAVAPLTTLFNSVPLDAECGYSLAVVAGSTDFVYAVPTATGYTWQRRTTALALVSSANVATTANVPCDVCADTSLVTVVNSLTPAIDAVTRQFNAATGALVAGPTSCTVAGVTSTLVITFVGISQVSGGASVQVIAQASDAAFTGSIVDMANTTLALSFSRRWANARAVTRPVNLPDTRVGFAAVAAPGAPAANTAYMIIGSANSSPGNPFNLRCEATFGAGTADPVTTSVINRRTVLPMVVSGNDVYVSLPTRDPRSETHRASLYRFRQASSRRRRGAVSNRKLYLAGGWLAVLDDALARPAAFLVPPVIQSAVQTTLPGGTFVAGNYQYTAVYRCVLSDGRVQQSAPAAVTTLTVTGAAPNQGCVVTIHTPVDGTLDPWLIVKGAFATLDLYRTELGGSIPRLISSVEISDANGLGGSFTISDVIPDSQQQGGAPVYTQGADGIVSGRLPLGAATPCTDVVTLNSALVLSGGERRNELQLSAQNVPGETIGFVNDDLFTVTFPEDITAIAATTARRIAFSSTKIYEVIGDAPNVSGIGDISEPFVLDPSVGCKDWRSVCSTEMGVFFRSANDARPALYLLPITGSTAVRVSDAIEDILRDFPEVVSVSRNETEQLLTFALQTLDGTDGRLVHLDLQSSGLGQRGWVGRWFVDRVAILEGERAPEIVASATYSFNMVPVSASAPAALMTIPLPEGRQLGDRIVIMVHTQGGQNATPTGYTTLVNAFTSSGVSVMRVYERVLTTAAAVLSSVALSQNTAGIAGAYCWKVFLVRGSDPAQQSAVGFSATTGSTGTSPVVTPGWGSAKNMWLTMGCVDFGTSPSLANVAANNLTAVRGAPTGYGGVDVEVIFGGANSTVDTGELASAWKQERRASDQVTWTWSASQLNGVALIAIKPLAATGTPVLATAEYQQRIALCNSTVVYIDDLVAVSDPGGLQIDSAIDLCTIYPMGSGGAGRHTGVTFVGELLGFCALTALFSYDDGITWHSGRTHHLHPANNYQIGQTVRVHWTPLRRKIEGVRVRIECTSEDGVVNPVTGTTRGVAFNELTLWFDGLLGKSRVSQSRSL